MFQLEYVNPSLDVAYPKGHGPVRYLPSPFDSQNELSGLDIGKFFKRAFHVKGIVKKVPRMLAGAASGYVMGGGWSGAAAGAVSAGAFRRQAGTSLFQDIYRGGLYGMIGGGAVGAGKVALGRSSEAGLVGTGYEYLQKTFFAPKPIMGGTVYNTPIGPTLPTQGNIDPKAYGITPDPSIYSVKPAGSINLPTSTSSGSLWDSVFSVSKQVLPGALKVGETTLGYMTSQQQAKAAQYNAASQETALQSAMLGTSSINPVDPFGMPNVVTPGGLPFGSYPTGVPSDFTGGSAGTGGGVAYPITPEGGGEEAIPGAYEQRPMWMNPLVIGGVGLAAYVLFIR